MRRLELEHAWRPAAVLLVAALAACGGGGGTGPNGDFGQIAGDYNLVMVDSVAAPVTILFDHCDQVRFRTGGMRLGEDGTWEIVLRLDDANGNQLDMEDHGQFARAGNRLSFKSDAFGDQFKGELDATLVHLYYDWCGEGHADVDLTFTN
jgi:hypothetical protein